METRTVTLEVNDQGGVHLPGLTVSFLSHSRGYQTVKLQLHRLVALAFHGPPPPNMLNPVVHHIDGDPHNNAANNLEWLSSSENVKRHYKGRPRLLTPADVETIRLMKPSVSLTLHELAEMFGVSYAAVSAVRSGRTFTGKQPSNRAILTPEQVQVIRKWKAPKPSAASVARKFKVSKTVIYSIWNGKY